MKFGTKFEEFLGPHGFRMGRGMVLTKDKDFLVLKGEDGTQYLVSVYGVFTVLGDEVKRRGFSIPM